MKLSTKGRYGLRAVVDIAHHCTSEPASLSSIAARQKLSEGYLEQIIAKLKKAGIVLSARGSGGGYRLAKAPEDITVGDVLRALEGDLTVCECQERKDICGLFDQCVTKYVWERINNSINHVVDTMTIREVIRFGEQNRKEDEFNEQNDLYGSRCDDSGAT